MSHKNAKRARGAGMSKEKRLAAFISAHFACQKIKTPYVSNSDYWNYLYSQPHVAMTHVPPTILITTP